MTDARDDQDESEALDDDELDTGDYPPEHSLGLRELAAKDVTAADEYAPDSVAERSWREEPDFDEEPLAYDERESVAGLLEPDQLDGLDIESELVGEQAEPDDDLGGPHLSDSPDTVGDPDRLSAEEAAIHREDG